MVRVKLGFLWKHSLFRSGVIGIGYSLRMSIDLCNGDTDNHLQPSYPGLERANYRTLMDYRTSSHVRFHFDKWFHHCTQLSKKCWRLESPQIWFLSRIDRWEFDTTLNQQRSNSLVQGHNQFQNGALCLETFALYREDGAVSKSDLNPKLHPWATKDLDLVVSLR